MATTLITGGSGLVGMRLTHLLLEAGHRVRLLGRSGRADAAVPLFLWNIERGTVDARALEGVDHIIHLSGAGIADKRWTPARKDVLLASRVASAELLLREAQRSGAWPKTFISASGVNYYGTATSDRIFKEEDPAANDFLGKLCRAWEQAADQWMPHCRVVKMRTAVALATAGGALPKLVAPARWGLAAPLGTGKQWMPWVHIEDLARAYLHVIRDAGMSGAYNVAAPEDVRNGDFTRELANALHRPYFLPNIPAFALRTLLDGPAGMVLEGSRVSNAKLLESGFAFTYPRLKPALEQLLG
ncbi:MAG: TIGR01777 family oxidoreductase [Flavobacteriales bacterium]|nr:TIGR01777 family oxidoreductase [Flavobacteriales bacterium]MBP9080471.1 TIGR01777 family oxidoreductase [Flavobacteriales bacterium]